MFYTTGVTQSLGDGTFAGGVLLYTVPVGFEFYLQRVQMGAQDNNPVPDVSWVNFGSIQGEPVFSTKPDAILHSVDFTIPFPVFTAGSELKIWTERSGTTKVVGNCQMLGFLVSIKTP